MPREQTDSWFVTATDFCTKIVNGVFLELASCVRFAADEEVEDGARCIYYSAHQLVLSVENRDSMALLAAIFTGREDKARELLALPWTNINAQYSNGNTPLILAVQGNNDRLVHMLVSHPNVNVNMRGLDGFTALIKACGQEKGDYVRMLLSHPEINVNLSTYYGANALTYSIRCGNEEAANMLLQRHDIDVNLQSCGGRRRTAGAGITFGENALIEAIIFRRQALAKRLILRPDIVLDVMDERDRTPLILSVQHGYASLVRLLLHNGCDPHAEDDHGRNALYYAIKRGSLEVVEDLLASWSKEPQTLTRICRTVIRRHLRYTWGPGDSLKTVFDQFSRNELPRSLKRFLAYET